MPQSKQTKRAKALKYLDARIAQLESVIAAHPEKDSDRYRELERWLESLTTDRRSTQAALGSYLGIDHATVNAYVPQLSPIWG